MTASVLAILFVLAQADEAVDVQVDEPAPALVEVGEPAPAFTVQELFTKAREEFDPIVCRLSYSVELTQPSGEVSKRDSTALGLVVSEGGLVMAPGHMLLENRKPYNIKAEVGIGDDLKEYDATLLQKPDDINVCFLQLKADTDIEFDFIRFDDESGLGLGAEVFLLGIMGDAFDYVRAVQNRRISAVLEKPRTTYCLGTTVPFGYVGAPVMDSEGNAAGVVGYDLSATEGGDLYTRSGAPLVYYRALFQKYIDEPPGEESLNVASADAWLGVFTQPLSDDLAEYWGLDQSGGIVVSTVIGGSPADRVGLRAGDVIVMFNGVPLTAKQDSEVMEFTKTVRESPLEEPIPFKLLREGRPAEFRVTLTSRPKGARDATEYVDEVFGITAREITQDVRILLNLTDDAEGVIVRRVRPGSPANMARIMPGFIIMRFGDHRVANVEDFENAVNAVVNERPEEITLFCRVGTSTAFFRIQPRWDEQE